MRLIVEADGGSRGNPGVAAYGALVRDGASGQVLAERAAYLGDAVTNNVAEYHGLIAGLEAAAEVDPAAGLDVRMDSKLVVSQMSGEWKIKNRALAELAARAWVVIAGREVRFIWVPRANNQAADALANQAMDSAGVISRGPGGVVGGGAAGAVGSRVGAGVGGSASGSEYLHDSVRLAQAQGSGAQRHIGVSAPVTGLILVRHGMSLDTARDVFAGQALPGSPLSDAGAGQAMAAARELRRMVDLPWFGLTPPKALLVSPTARSVRTAELIGDEFGLACEVDAGFVEQNFGLWDGLTKPEVEAKWPGGPETWSADPSYRPEGGESRQELGQRVHQAVDQVVRRYRGETVLIVSHAMAIRAAIGAALGAPPAAWFTFRIAPASISLLRFWDLGHTEVVCTNHTVA
jgi:probable phosphoglycerate mutase